IGLVAVDRLDRLRHGVSPLCRGTFIVGPVVRCVKVKLNGDSVFRRAHLLRNFRALPPLPCVNRGGVAIDAGEVVGWLKAFALTELIEAPIYRFAIPSGWSPALLASAITHPFVWFAFPRVADHFEWSWELTVILSELFAWSVEAAFFRWVCRAA